MKKHNGMRPLDIVVLLKILTYKDKKWYYIDLSRTLFISQSEISESINRSKIARLLSPDSKTVFRNSFYEFLKYGLRYVFPASPGVISRGIPTAHSAKPISDLMPSPKEVYVWSDDNGYILGQSIEPLYKNIVRAVKTDNKLYEYLSLIDIIRVGVTREIKLANEELKKRIFE